MMAARSFRDLAHVASGLLALLGAAGCVDDGVSLHVICPIFPEIEEDACTYDAQGEECLLEGVVNLAAGTGYQMNLRVESGLTARERQVPPQGEPNGMQITGASVELRDASGARLKFAPVREGDRDVEVPNPYSVVATGYIAPGSFGAVTVPAIDARHLSQFIAGAPPAAPKLSQIVVAVKLKGKTSGDTSIDGGEYTWPVRLVNLDTRAAQKQCRPIGYCSGSFGQDLYAEACRP